MVLKIRALVMEKGAFSEQFFLKKWKLVGMTLFSIDHQYMIKNRIKNI